MRNKSMIADGGVTVYRTIPVLAGEPSMASMAEDLTSGYPVKEVVQQTRCVTLFYADNMHLDVTPALRDYGTTDRQSAITHAKGPLPWNDDSMVPMNAYGHAEWYRARTPNEERVIEAFKDRWFGDGRTSIRADAEVDEVPDQTQFIVKNMATVALQLLKRYRNVRYANHSGRIPPSVMLSYFAGAAALPDMKLSDMLVRICRWIIGEIERASINHQKIHVVNPTYSADVFTDRWPENLDQQNQFARCLHDLVAGIERAKRGELEASVISDPLRQFIEAKCNVGLAEDGHAYFEPTQQLYRAFIANLPRVEEQFWTTTRFSKALKGMGYKRVRCTWNGRQEWGYRGIRLKLSTPGA